MVSNDGVPHGAEELRASVLALRAPLAAMRAPAPQSSVYGRAAAATPGVLRQAAPWPVLAGRLRAVETTALLPGTTLTLLVAPGPSLPPELADSCRLLVEGGATVVALGAGLPREVSDRSRLLTVPLRRGDPLAAEWALVACGPQRRVAFLARRRPDTPVWDWLVTREPIAVQRAACALLERVPFLHLLVPALAPAAPATPA
jgi:hypothetical protein